MGLEGTCRLTGGGGEGGEIWKSSYGEQVTKGSDQFLSG